MAIDLLLDSDTNDLILKDGEFQYTTSKLQLLRQRMEITFKTFVNEWFADVTFGGVDRDIVLGKVGSKGAVDAWFINVINSFEDVLEIAEFKSTLDAINRTYSLTFIVLTDEGEQRFFIVAGPPNIEVEYPFQSQEALGLDCGLPAPLDSNELYEFIHIEWPTTASWATTDYAVDALTTETGLLLLDEDGNFLEHE